MSAELANVAPLPPRERARNQRRQLLLAVAEDVFAERGFAGATMAEIASRAGYSAANLYNVFDNKEALFAEVLTSSAELVVEFTQKAAEAQEGFEATLDQLLDSILHFVVEHRGFFVILTQSSPDFDWRRNHPNEGAMDIGEELDRQNQQMFARALTNGEIPDGNPRAYSCILRGTINSYISRWVREEGSVEDLWEGAKDLRKLLKRTAGLGASAHA